MSSSTKKMKRKDHEFDLDNVSDDFSDFSLSSPARKIRRLDAELPPIIEEEEADVALDPASSEQGSFVELVEPNDERAIVLFNPGEFSLPSSVSGYSISPRLITNLKNQALWKNRSRPVIVELDGDEEEENIDIKVDTNSSLAVIPWNPSQKLKQQQAPIVEEPDSMEAEDKELEPMDIEEEMGAGLAQANEFGNQVSGSESMQQHVWQQQHCMMPQPPQNIPAPVIWYR
ncbi:hypothetical protein Drorol1_Dr00006745 [Drosera rotundifolia]